MTQPRIMKSAIIFLLAVIIFLAACSKSAPNEDIETCTDVLRSFAGDINPIIQTYCNQPTCHASGSVNGPGPLTNYTQVYNARSVIREAIRSGFMPQEGTLTTIQRNMIICWIDNGAPDN